VIASQVSAQTRTDALRGDHGLPVLMRLMQCLHRRQSGSFPPGFVCHLLRLAFHLVFAKLGLDLFGVWAGMNSARAVSSQVCRMKAFVAVFRLNRGRLVVYLGRVKA
jgi:hypothetical protein